MNPKIEFDESELIDFSDIPEIKCGTEKWIKNPYYNDLHNSLLNSIDVNTLLKIFYLSNLQNMNVGAFVNYCIEDQLLLIEKNEVDI